MQQQHLLRISSWDTTRAACYRERVKNVGMSPVGHKVLGEAMDRTLETIDHCARSICACCRLRFCPTCSPISIGINVSFAGLTMRGDLGMSAGTFGFAVACLLGVFPLPRCEQRDPGKGRRQDMDARS